MITRSLPLPRPIPFADPLHQGAANPLRDTGWMPLRPSALPQASPPAPRAALGSSSWMPHPLDGRGRPTASQQDAATDRQAAASALPASSAGAPARVAGVSAQSRSPQLPAEALPRRATARYDGPHSLSVRSSTTGRHYRFPQQGATQVIDAADIALMRRIEDITLL